MSDSKRFIPGFMFVRHIDGGPELPNPATPTGSGFGPDVVFHQSPHSYHYTMGERAQAARIRSRPMDLTKGPDGVFAA